MKRLFAFLLAFLLACGTIGAVAESSLKSGLYTYEIKGNGTIRITGYDWDNSVGDIYIPNMLDGYTITEIGEAAFARESFEDNKDKDAISITLPNTITTIGERAFFHTAITSIIIPENIESIGAGALADCRNITRFSVAGENKTYTTIDGALYNKKTKALVAWPFTMPLTAIPEGIVELGDYAFWGMKIYGEFNKEARTLLPETIKRIGKHCFSYTEFDLVDNGGWNDSFFPQSLAEIDDYAFYKCYFHENIKFSSNLKRIGKYAFAYSDVGISLSLFAFDSDIEYDLSIDDFAFTYSNGFGLPSNGHVYLGEGVFEYGNAPILRDSIETFGPSCFIGSGACTELHNRSDEFGDFESYLTIAGKYKVIPDEAFRNENRTTIKITIEEGITEAGKYSFADRKGLKELVLPTTLATIKEGAFSNCPSLTTITFAEGIESIEDSAFADTPALKEVSLPASLTYIGNKAFDRDTITLLVEEGSFAELWAKDNGYSYQYAGSDDLSWLE